MSVAIRHLIERKMMIHQQVAEKSEVGRITIAAIMNRNLQTITTDRLIDTAQWMGFKSHLPKLDVFFNFQTKAENLELKLFIENTESGLIVPG